MQYGMAIVLIPILATSALGAQKALSAVRGWVRTPAADEKTATAFVFIENPTMYDVYVTSATSDVAGAVTFQKAAADAKPEPVEFISVPAYGAVDMNMNGVSLLLKELKRPLKEGETIDLTLTTDGGVTLAVSAPVRSEP